jgi:hypothetical protein
MSQSEPFESDSADQPGVFSSLRTICRGGIDFSGATVFGWNAADVFDWRPICYGCGFSLNSVSTQAPMLPNNF